FSEDSGFFEDGFVLKLSAMESVRQGEGIEIRYTLNGDEPTADSLLYEDGIDLAVAAKEALAEAERLEAERREVIHEAEQQKAAAEAEQPETAGSAASTAAAQEETAGSAATTAAAQGETAGSAATTDVGSAEVKAEALAAALEPGETAGNAEDLIEEETAGSSEDPKGAETEAAGSEKEKTAETPSVEEGRETWRKEVWTAASDNGVWPERTRDGICVIPVRACLIQGEDRSPVVTRTYVIGPGVRERWQDVCVVSVSTDSGNLFDYENGIMVKGSHYRTDLENGVREDRAGNFYQEGDSWIKDGHVTLFSPDGEVLMEEDAGLSISGYSSRILPTRSFRAEASRARGSSGDTFSLDIFTPAGGADSPADGAGSGTSAAADSPADGSNDQSMAAAGSPADGGAALSNAADPETGIANTVDRFRKIKFRTHGIPTYHIRSVRNQYAKQLTDECGFPGLTENRLGVMFLNGEFYTVCDVTPSADKAYLCRLFGLNVPDAMEKYSGSDVDVYTRAKIIKLFTADLKDPANREALEQAVDMDNYLFYFALEVLLNNVDWPYNNVTIWRYLGEEDPENPYTDGRIRFVLDDMDQILSNNLHGDPARWSTELIDYLMKDKGATFYHVMECEKYRNTFLTYVDDLLRTAFEPEHACGVLDALYEGLHREYILDYGEAFWKEMEHTAFVTKQNVREKEKLYRANITKYMGLTDRFEVRIEAGEGVTVTWNNDCGTSPDKKIQVLQPGQSRENEYYRGTSFTAEAVPAEGYWFAGWEVNGVPVENAAGNPEKTGTGGAENSGAASIRVSDELLPEGQDAAVTLRAVAVPAQ
ncbi:MAG: CotH kinase family protein, partial [Eubacteriales bacterium]|nr:CotH kinase family protein [Eubacteriales bacterium]